MLHALRRLLPALLGLLAAPLVSAATIVVDSGADDGTGGCTLRDALQAAAVNAPVGGCTAGDPSGSDVIEVTASTITLTSPIAIISPVIIQGDTSAPPTIQRAGTGRVFTMNGGSAQVRWLRFVGGPNLPSGGITIDNGAVLIVENCTFEGNVAERWGGAIAAFDGSNLDVVLTEFRGNRVSAGGLNDGGGAIFIEQSELSVDEGTFIENRSLSDTSRGGAIHARIASSVTIGSSTFDGNRADLGGGAVVCVFSALDVRNTLFVRNRVIGPTSLGGALYVTGTPATTLDGVTIRDNSAARGGGFAAGETTATLTDTVIRANRASSTATVAGGGGGVYLYASDVTIDGGEISRNRAVADNGMGGGMLLWNGSLTMTGGTVIEANRAFRRGGGVAMIFGATADITDAVIRNNRLSAPITFPGSVSDGGGISMIDVSDLTLTTSTVSGNFAKGSGGGVWVGDEATLATDGGFITDNRAFGQLDGHGGGGVFVADAASATLTTTRIEDNEARADLALGGGAYVAGGSARFERVRFRRNLGGRGGGGLAVTDGGDAVVEGASDEVALFEANLTGRATGDGGGLFVGDGSTATATLTRFQTNDAWRSGGAVFSTGTGSFSAVKVSIQQNRARVDGGGLYQASGNGSNTMRIYQALLWQNVADRGDGGALYVGTGATAELLNSTVHDNAARLGGGVFSSLASLRVDSATITDNTATTNGGGLANADGNDRPVAFRNSIVADNAGGDLAGRFGSDGFNIVGSSPSAAVFAAVASDQIGTDPDLLPLASNGGPTFTRSPAEGSPAIDAGNTSFVFDQRGTTRLASPDDIGALEVIPEAATAGVAPETMAAPDAQARTAEPVRLDAAPNPVRGRATVSFAVGEAQRVTVAVYDVTGRRVRTLFDGTPASGEPVTATLDAGGLAAGVYVVVLDGETVRATRRVSVVR